MSVADVIAEGERVLTICNACRYCEGFCAVFPAIERRLTFAEADMNYLANLCHNCTECLHACQYAEPHPFAVNVPMTLARLRLRTYEQYCWPQALGSAFRLRGTATVLSLAALLIVCMLAATRLLRRDLITRGSGADFYAVVPHDVLVSFFGAVVLFVLGAIIVGIRRYVKDTGSAVGATGLSHPGPGLRDALTLKYMHGSGLDCTIQESVRTPWRRWCHHLALYGFLLCVASTSVAAIYHGVGFPAPYPFFSTPVLLGTLGGIGLIAGPVGLWAIRKRRDPRTVDPDQKGLDRSFMMVLLLTSATGLALLALRSSAAMGVLLIVHLGMVLTLFLTLPYGKFVHGLYRTVALIQNAGEARST